MSKTLIAVLLALMLPTTLNAQAYDPALKGVEWWPITWKAQSVEDDTASIVNCHALTAPLMGEAKLIERKSNSQKAAGEFLHSLSVADFIAGIFQPENLSFTDPETNAKAILFAGLWQFCEDELDISLPRSGEEVGQPITDKD